MTSSQVWHFVIHSPSFRATKSDIFFYQFFFRRVVYKTPGVTTGRGQNIFNCKYNSPPPHGKVCDVNIKDFKKCTQENNYSYHKSSPCVFVKLNRIYGWIPQFYNDTNQLPERMPRQLKQKINATDAAEVSFAQSPPNAERMCLAYHLLCIVFCRLSSWTRSGYRVKVRIRLTSRTSVQLSTIRAKDSQATISRMRTRKAIWAH